MTFLVVSLGLALFAETYRATLVRGQHDQAAFAVPRDLVVSEDLTKLVTVTDAAPLAASTGSSATRSPSSASRATSRG